jgi:glutamine amidotransferase
MGALVAVLQNDPNLMRCQVARLSRHVALAEPDRPPDAYGFGYYTPTEVLVGKRPTGAPGGPMGLVQLVGEVDSEVVLAQARYAAASSTEENTPPFRYRRWLFAHDGAIEGFSLVKAKLASSLPDFLRRGISGDTDKEHAFMVFLQVLREGGHLDDLDLEAGVAADALARTVRRIDAWCREAGAQKPSELTFVATNGRVLAATRRGGPLSYALLEGIVPCPLHPMGPGTSDTDPRVRPHRTAKAVCFATHLTADPNGFLDVPEASVVAVSRDLRVSISPLHTHG